VTHQSVSISRTLRMSDPIPQDDRKKGVRQVFAGDRC
jgi:hypothetical protein